MDVVQRYQATVSSISEAEAASGAADASVSATQQRVEVRTLATLQHNASTSRENSVALENAVNARNTDVAGTLLRYPLIPRLQCFKLVH